MSSLLLVKKSPFYLISTCELLFMTCSRLAVKKILIMLIISSFFVNVMLIVKWSHRISTIGLYVLSLLQMPNVTMLRTWVGYGPKFNWFFLAPRCTISPVFMRIGPLFYFGNPADKPFKTLLYFTCIFCIMFLANWVIINNYKS